LPVAYLIFAVAGAAITGCINTSVFPSPLKSPVYFVKSSVLVELSAISPASYIFKATSA